MKLLLLLLLLFLFSFPIHADTWIVTAHNELTDSYFACHPDNEIDGNGCIKLESESKTNQFFEQHKDGFGEHERWIKEKDMRPELYPRVIDERIVEIDIENKKPELETKPILTRIVNFFISEKTSYKEYLVKADYVYTIKDITDEIEIIEQEKQTRKTDIDEIKNINVNTMTDAEMKKIINRLIKELRK